MTPLERARASSMILAALAAMSDSDIAIVAAVIRRGAPSAIAAHGSAPVYKRHGEHVANGPPPAGVVVFDPEPDADSRVQADVLAAYRAVATRDGLVL